MKNIAIVITKLELGGAQKVALYLAKNLDRKKYSIHFITGAGGLLDNEAEKIKGVKKVFLKEMKRPVSPLNDIRAFFKLKKYFTENKIDIVHTHSSKAGFLGRLAASAAGVPYIIHTIHGFSFHEYQNPFIHTLYVWLEKFAAAKTNRLVAVGEDVKEYGLKKGVGSPSGYSVIRAGVNLSLFARAKPDRKALAKKIGLTQRDYVVGMLGNFKKQKNPFEFLEIAKETIKAGPEIKFVFGGGGSEKEKKLFNKKIAELNLEKNVTAAGWVKEPEKFMKTIDVFLLTSLWEGLPCTLVQAAAAGTPCIATDITGNRELLKKLGTGSLYTPGNYREAAEKTLLFKNMKRPEEKYGPKTRGILREFDLKYMLKKHEELYDKI